MEKVVITKVYRSDSKKDGTKFIGRNGKPFWKVAIQTDKYGSDWFSTFAFSQDDEEYLLKEGDEKTIVITESNGFKNFKLPTRLDFLEARVDALERYLKAKKDDIKEKVSTDPISEDINPDDIPF